MIAVVIVAVALGVRLVHLWFIRDAPVFDVLMGDARAYDEWGQRIAGGEWIGTDVFYQAPLYPYFLGMVYSVAGHDLWLVRVVQAVLGSASAVLLASAAERLFSKKVGLMAGLGLALYAPAIFFDGLLQKTVLDVFFVCLTIWLSSRIIAPASSPARLSWFALGLALGGLSLTRENALALVAVAGAWALVGTSGASMSIAIGRFQRTALLAGGLALVLLPVATRNYAVAGGFYLTTSQFGPNFYIGNNPQSDGTYMSLRAGRGAPEFERQDATEIAERALQRALTPAEVSRYWTDRALDFVTTQPAAWLQLMGRKAALLVNTSEMLDTESQETYEEYSPVLRGLAIAGHFGILVPLAALGLVAAWPDRRRLWPLYAMLAAYAASVVVFYVFARYRFPLVPFFVLFAAVGVDLAPGLIRVGLSPGRAAALAGLLALTVVVNWPLLSSTRMRAITETNLGVALHEAGRLDEAVAHYRRATTLQADYAPAYNNLGVTLRAQGHVDEAIATYERALALRDDYPDLHYNLANALLEQNRSDEAAAHLKVALAVMPGSAAAHNNLGTAFAANNQFEQAAAQFRAAIAADAQSSLAHRNLGNVLASMGRLDEAVQELRLAVSLDPKDAAAHYDLGSLLLELSRFDEAATAFRAALAIDARHVRALNNLGIARASRGAIAEAIGLFEKALAVQPDFADARRNLETARRAVK